MISSCSRSRWSRNSPKPVGEKSSAPMWRSEMTAIRIPRPVSHIPRSPVRRNVESEEKERVTMNRRRVLALLAGSAGVLAMRSAASASLSAEQGLADIHLSAADRQRVLGGEFITADVPRVSDRDLSFAIAFLVKSSPAVLGDRVMSGDLVTADAQVQAWAELKGVGSLADFSRLEITSDEARALSTARPEGEL